METVLEVRCTNDDTLRIYPAEQVDDNGNVIKGTAVVTYYYGCPGGDCVSEPVFYNVSFDDFRRSIRTDIA
jgi:hypothetical protein